MNVVKERTRGTHALVYGDLSLRLVRELARRLARYMGRAAPLDFSASCAGSSHWTDGRERALDDLIAKRSCLIIAAVSKPLRDRHRPRSAFVLPTGAIRPGRQTRWR